MKIIIAPDSFKGTMSAKTVASTIKEAFISEDENITVKNEAVTGSWSRVNTALSTDAVTDEVFLVGIDHGVKPNNAKYEVIILPETT